MNAEHRSAGLPRRLTRRILARTLALTLALTALLLALQLLRVFDSLSSDALPLPLVGELALRVTPALLTITLPLALLAAAALTLAQDAEAGALLAWRALGYPIRDLLRPATRLATAAAALTALLAGWVGPAQLASARDAVLRSSLTTQLQRIHPEAELHIGAATSTSSQLSLGPLRAHHPGAGWRLNVATLTLEPETGEARAAEVDVGTGTWEVRAGRAHVKLSEEEGGALSHLTRAIPRVETQGAAALAAASPDDARLSGQLAKRIVLSSTPLLLPLLLLMMLRAEPLRRSAGALLVALLLGAGAALTARGVELLTQQGPITGLAIAGATPVVVILVGVIGARRFERRW